MDEFPAGLTSIIDSDILAKYAIDKIKYIPNYTELCSLIDEGITVTDVIEKAETIQNYPQLSHVEEQQLSLSYIVLTKKRLLMKTIP
ncbi:hypothetical protein [Trichormus azollae]|uniref:hypothetical protein n=1 Tax=Trichormus azollae TaxID=1164 RepID=UPI00325F15CF